MKIILMSDTHGLCDKKIEKYLSGCDEIWHAGDIGSMDVANRLREIAPLRAVYGNIDDQNVRHEFSEFHTFECEGAQVLMTHIGGFPGKYDTKALRQIFAVKPKIFVCGHSHILRVMYDKHHDMLVLNPGAAGIQGFHQVRTLLRFEIEKGEIKNMEVIEIPR
jgi:putative phosphoesterase